MNNNLNYTHFAVSKINNKIIDGWDYSDIDPEELRAFRKDYFTQDLIDNNIDPRNIRILNKKACIRLGLDPDDDSNWSNFVNENINETSRANKAINTIKGNTSNPNRIVKNFAIMSAENPMGQELSHKENGERRNDLLMRLSIGHYRFFKVKGQYGNKENSVIIYNIQLEDAIFLGDKYNQESIIWCELDYQENGQSKVYYQYWERSGEGQPLKKTVEKDRIIDAQNFDDFFTQIKRGFKFQIPFFEHYKKIGSIIAERSNKSIDEVERLINESLDNYYTKKHHWLIRGKLYGRQGNIVCQLPTG